MASSLDRKYATRVLVGVSAIEIMKGATGEVKVEDVEGRRLLANEGSTAGKVMSVHMSFGSMRL